MFKELNKEELMETEGGMPFILGVLAAAGVVAVTGVVVAGSVVLVGKVAQKFSDWLG